jgi:hypothetical protein
LGACLFSVSSAAASVWPGNRTRWAEAAICPRRLGALQSARGFTDDDRRSYERTESIWPLPGCVLIQEAEEKHLRLVLVITCQKDEQR